MACLICGCIKWGAKEKVLLSNLDGLELKLVSSQGFNLTTYQRFEDNTSDIRIYIEGDGRAWISSSQPSNDPTPQHPLALMLARQDHWPNVVYIARPCQFSKSTSPKCSVEYWTDKRFSVDVIRSYYGLLNDLRTARPNQKFQMIGYSGGGAVATLLSVRRKDISSLRTIAGNLDHEYVNKFHHVDLMPDSLNPIAFTYNLQDLPQQHFIADKDSIIPAEVAKRFVELQDGKCAQITVVKRTTHSDGWEERWQELLKVPVECEKDTY